ncbi:molybdate ABC transporter substrate-binding protein [Azorhizobium oxalatiphilum]|uniref:Molybdate ABC transporter substrate-binding protein n=1 Tax=Azorhizobium oxalatiphilum TaxID=980631 RepID=A0A917BXQ1_9HYPH|nr:molybdate ABC transporter substrate-binding protein [Azorhizobium oxalatiphilum]GGF60611.1 molybdate ABC transporter substrate-binding protein [Azorhizobium oxalatiphilum]
MSRLATALSRFDARFHGRRALLSMALAAVVGAAVPTFARAQEAVTVFAAASMTNAIQDISKAYTEKTKVPVRTSFAASSDLAKQIQSGAPANVFISADTRWMDFMEKNDLVVKDTRVEPIGNSLVVIVPSTKPTKITINSSFDFETLLGKDGKLVTGIPESVPVGVYAKAALTKLGLWDKVRPHVVGAESVRAALALVERGEAAAGIVYATDAAVAKNVTVAGTFPADSHDPVVYPFAIVKGQDTPAAKAFFEYLLSPEAKAVYAKYGFTTK